MWHYEPPLADIRFVVDELLGLPAQWARMPAFAEVDGDTAHQVITEAGRFAAEVLAPINAEGDRDGCRWQAGEVTTPRGYREAYRAFVEAGWPALACEPDAGGQGLPQVLNAALFEMLAAANHGWTMYPGLLHGAYECLHVHADETLKARYLAKVTSGEWLSTMCLTEAHAGSDLGLLRTRAEPREDGSVAITGSKIFISGGEHDLTENIVHLVLARLPGAPGGTKGLSLFLAPKILPDGSRNAIRCDGIEHKMGIHGSATCAMSFEGATGWIVGEPHRGLAAMFAMMNAARLHVGLQGLGHAEAATQNALRYAQERRQMRAATRPPGAESQGADPIAWHPAVRRTLWRLRALTEGGRVLAYEAAHAIDVAAHGETEAQRREAADEAALLTPIVKAFLTDNGFAAASEALQLWGGHGYIVGNGIEQTLRDSRIAMLYEGTNEIQAVDLLVRKVLPDGGARLRAMIDRRFAALPASALGRRAATVLGEWQAVVGTLVDAAAGDAELGHRAAVDHLRLAGLALMAEAWARAEALASPKAATSPFHAAKAEAARQFFALVLPDAEGCLRRLRESAPLPHLPTA